MLQVIINIPTKPGARTSLYAKVNLHLFFDRRIMCTCKIRFSIRVNKIKCFNEMYVGSGNGVG